MIPVLLDSKRVPDIVFISVLWVTHISAYLIAKEEREREEKRERRGEGRERGEIR